MSLSTIIPRPLRDFITVPYAISENNQEIQKARSEGTHSAANAKELYGRSNRIEANKLINACFRIATAALGVFAVMSSGASVPVALALGAVVSLPAAIIVIGCGLLNYGGAAIIASLASGSFYTLGLGLFAVGAGCVLLEEHDKHPSGLAERYVFDPIALRLTASYVS